MPFNNNKEKKEDKRPIRYIEKLIAAFVSVFFPEVRKQGINIGKNNPPKSDVKILEIPYVGTIIAKVTGLFNDISGSLENTIQENKTKFEQAFRQLKDNKIIATLASTLKGLKTQKEADLQEIDDRIEQEKTDIQAEQDKLEKQIRQNNIAIGEHPYKNVFWPILFAVLISVGILSSEVFVNQKAFLFQAGENFFTSLIIAFGISLFTFSMGLATAKIIQNKKISAKNKIFYIAFFSLIVIGVAFGIAEMRTSMMEIMSQGQTGRASFVVSKFTLILINTGFYVSLVIVKIFFVPSPRVFESNRKNREVKLDTQGKEKALKQFKKEVKDFPKKATTQKKAVLKKYAADKIEVEQELKDNYEQIRSYQIAYNKNLSVANNVHKQLSNLTKRSYWNFYSASKPIL